MLCLCERLHGAGQGVLRQWGVWRRRMQLLGSRLPEPQQPPVLGQLPPIRRCVRDRREVNIWRYYRALRPSHQRAATGGAVVL